MTIRSTSACTLSACPLRDLPPDHRQAFYQWIETLTTVEDNEDGAGFAGWLRHHETVCGDVTWVFRDATSDALLGTASLVTHDRDTAADPGGWVLGGVNVVRDRRGSGIGAAIMGFIDAEVMRRARAVGHPVSVKLMANYPPAIRLYERFGFQRVPACKDLFMRTYLP